MTIYEAINVLLQNKIENGATIYFTKNNLILLKIVPERDQQRG